MATQHRILAQAHSYKTLANAERVLTKALENIEGHYKTVITVNADGRFTPVVINPTCNDGFLQHHYFIERNVSVIVDYHNDTK